MTTAEEKIESEITPLVRELGCEIVKVTFLEHSGSKVIQIMIERSDGNSVNVDDCQRISRALSLKLDVMNPITGRYNLEISSPGIDRPLLKLSDFKRFCGKAVVVKTYALKEGRKNFHGFLETATEDGIKVRLDTPLSSGDDFVSLLYGEISSAHIDGFKK